MIIDRICDRYNGVAYNPRDFYYYLIESNDYYSQRISAAFDGGENSDVQKVLCEYIRKNGYKLWFCNYINKKDWINADKVFQYREILQTRYELILKNIAGLFSASDNRKYNDAIWAFANVLKATDKDFVGADAHEIADIIKIYIDSNIKLGLLAQSVRAADS